MAVRVRIPATLRELPGARSVVSLDLGPSSVSDVFEALWREVPHLRDRILTETGEVREHVQVFVGVESIRYTGGLATAVPDGTEVSLVPAVSGG